MAQDKSLFRKRLIVKRQCQDRKRPTNTAAEKNTAGLQRTTLLSGSSCLGDPCWNTDTWWRHLKKLGLPRLLSGNGKLLGKINICEDSLNHSFPHLNASACTVSYLRRMFCHYILLVRHSWREKPRVPNLSRICWVCMVDLQGTLAHGLVRMEEWWNSAPDR